MGDEVQVNGVTDVARLLLYVTATLVGLITVFGSVEYAGMAIVDVRVLVLSHTESKRRANTTIYTVTAELAAISMVYDIVD